MAHFAKVQEGIVTSVIVADQAFIDTLPDSSLWIQTSYNTSAGKHRNGGEPLRMNYAGIGYSYSAFLDAFIPPRPSLDWSLDMKTCCWVNKKRKVTLPGEPIQGIYEMALKDNNGKSLYTIVETGPHKSDRIKIPATLRGILLDTRRS